ncbi:MAG: leucine-rich repeat domain-containing protein, partial [Muribaculaceae bacterium]|nr:leucine-rich repeat domain-containing protein [Muribaculaceae bacterium]
GVNIPSAVTEIGEYAFNNCAVVNNIVLPDDLVSIGRYAFAGCKLLNDIVIPNGITVIPQYCFRNCESLESIVLGQQIKSVEMYSFSGCTALKSVKLPDGLTELAQATFEKCESLVNLDIPATVTKLGNYAFDGCKSLVLDIPQQLTSIGSYAFRGCASFTTAVIPAAITSVPNYVFANCSALRKVTMSDHVTQIGSYAFQNCKALESIHIAGTEVNGADLGSVLPSALKNVMTYAFQNCEALKLNPDMPATLTQIGNYAFDGMKQLSAINLPEGFKTFGQYSFRNTSLKSIVIPQSVTNIQVNYAFVGCPVVYITNPVPGSIYTNTFKQTASAYVRVVVPSGTKADFDAKSSYWKNTKVVEPELNVAFTDEQISTAANSAQLTANIKVDYADDSVPERFRKADAAHLRSGDVQLLYRVADSSDESVAVAAVVGTDNVATVSLSSLAEATKYSYNWVYTLGSISVASSENEFTTSSTTTGVDGLHASDATIGYADGLLTISGYSGYSFTITNVAGSVVRTFECLAQSIGEPLRLTPGVYVVYGQCGADSVGAKILVK